MNSTNEISLSDEFLMDKIYYIRDEKVMLDKDLATIYNVETKVLKQAVRRNSEIFPEHFMFELTEGEFKNLRSQFVTSSWGGHRYLPYAFTEHGVLQLASVLRSSRARQMSIKIIEVFVKMRKMLETNGIILSRLAELERKSDYHDDKLIIVFEYLKQFEESRQQDFDQTNRNRIGYRK